MSIVPPLPVEGGVFEDFRDTNRWLRVSRHQEFDMVVVSTWRENECVAAFQLAGADVPRLIEMFAAMGFGTNPATVATPERHDDAGR
jgi:hypothetical protein